MKDWEEYEHFCINYHREKYKHQVWHWYNTPEDHLENSGYIHSFNKHRLERLRKYRDIISKESGSLASKVNNISDYGMDGLSLEALLPENPQDSLEANQIYHGLQMKYYHGKNKVTASDIGTFQSALICRLMVKNKNSKGYLYSSNKLEINLSEDLQNNPFIIYEKLQMKNENNLSPKIEKDETQVSLRPYQFEALKELHNFDENQKSQGNTDSEDEFSEISDSKSFASGSKASKIKTLSLFCGGGKTLISGHYLRDKNFELIIVMAPLKVSVDNLYTRLTPFLSQYKILVVDSDYTVGTTDTEIIEKFINDKSKPSIIYTTYDSAENLLDNLLKECHYKSGFILVDEVHNLVSLPKNKLSDFVNKFNDGLLLSATIPEELYETINATNVYTYNISQAIKDNYCVDYKIWIPLIIPKETETTLKSIEIPEGFPQNEICEKVLFLVTGMLKTGSRRCIVYLNSREECDIFNQLFSKVCSEYHGISSWTEKIGCEVVLERRRQILEQFQSEKTIKNTLHILSSVRILDEAVDIVKCDSEFIGSVGEHSSDIRCVQRLFRGGRLDKSNVNKINNLFIWSKEIPNVVHMLSLLRDSDPEFHKKVSILDGSYDSSGKSNLDRVELKAIELKNLEKTLEIKCLDYLEYHKIILHKVKDFKEKYGRYPKRDRKEINEASLASYMQNRRNAKKKNILNSELENLILSILPDWSWNPIYDRHFLLINQIKFFKIKYKEYPKKSGIRDNENILASYIYHKRKDKKNNKLNPELENLILSILPDWSWDPIWDNHILKLNSIKDFIINYKEYPKQRGIRDNEDDLASYIQTRRSSKKENKLDSELEKLINDILPDFSWDPSYDQHIININQIKDFKIKYNEYPKNNGIKENEAKLASYISHKRRDKKENKLDPELEKLINDILPDFSWDPIYEQHIFTINQIKDFKIKYNEYPKQKRIRDEGNEIKLSSYISHRRRDKKKNKLDPELEKLILSILPDLKLD